VSGGRAAIVGVGLIGGSLGLAWRRSGHFARVVGVERDAERSRAALASGAVDEATTDLARGVAGADLVVLAAPVRACLALLPAVARAASPGAVITDVASTKADLLAAVPAGAIFVGGHPLAGSERSGVEAAAADLFRGATWVLTPASATPAWAVARVAAAVRAAGAEPRIMEASEHDRRVALVSHLPQAVAVALAAAADGEALTLAARGFRDMTRLAESSPAVWADVFATNRGQVLAAIDAFQAALGRLRDAIAAGEDAAVAELFARAAAARRGVVGHGGAAGPT
jgi:prephenate dehydrogenase